MCAGSGNCPAQRERRDLAAGGRHSRCDWPPSLLSVVDSSGESSQGALLVIQAGAAEKPEPGETLPLESGCSIQEIFRGRLSGTWQETAGRK